MAFESDPYSLHIKFVSVQQCIYLKLELCGLQHIQIHCLMAKAKAREIY